jgi:hypothetical protein
VLSLSWTSAAGAQSSLASPNQLAIGLERLIGITWTRTKLVQPGFSEQVSTFAISRVTTLGETSLAGYAYPRLSVDWVSSPGITVGAALGYVQLAARSRYAASGDASGSSEDPTEHMLSFAPRVGYIRALTRALALWPRAGATIVHGWRIWSSSDINQETLNQIALTLELPLVIMPISQLALWIGPTLDVALSGSTTGSDIKTTEIGLQTAAAVYF